MNKLTKDRIRKMVMQELASMVGEDAIISPNNPRDEYRSNTRNRIPRNLSLTKHSDSYDDFGGAKDSCEQCGGMTYEGDCMECGYSGGKMLQEGGCGCGGSTSDDDGSDYSIDTMGMIGDALGVLTHAGYDVDATKGGHRDHNNYMANHPLGDYSNLNNTNITPEQAFDAGYEVSGIDDDNHRKHNNYMAKPSLYKVAKYAQKLLHMIPDGYELDDWQRTKIAQISDDISEVYHSLDYDFYDED